MDSSSTWLKQIKPNKINHAQLESMVFILQWCFFYLNWILQLMLLVPNEPALLCLVCIRFDAVTLSNIIYIFLKLSPYM